MRFFRPHALVAIALVAIGSARIATTWSVFNHTIDEPDNLAAGMEYLSTGKYRYEDTHPPLARVFAAVGPFLAGERFHPGPGAYFEGYRILGHDAHYDRILALGRAGILPFFWLASAVVYLWARRIRGPDAAVIATLLFTTIPPILAHSGVITTDMALCATVAAAGLAGLYWADKPTRPRSVIFGAAIALALISKFSALVFLPAAWLLMLIAGRRDFRWTRAHVRALAVVAATVCAIIWACYGFSFARVEFLHTRLPAPRFFSGIHAVWTHNRLGHPAYLFGQRSDHGFWYYFPAVLALKTPLGLVGLLALAPWLLWRSKHRAGAAIALAFSAGILLVSMTGRIDIGSRYLLPVYAGVCAAAGAAVCEARWPAARIAVAALLAWHVLSGAVQHPDYLAYTNEIAGSHPERYLADSDVDWGQDMKRLGDFLAQHGVAQFTFTPFNRTYAMAGHALPPMQPGETERPSPGWNAVSVTIWKVFGFPAWADRAKPDARVGRSILLYYVTPR